MLASILKFVSFAFLGIIAFVMLLLGFITAGIFLLIGGLRYLFTGKKPTGIRIKRYRSAANKEANESSQGFFYTNMRQDTPKNEDVIDVEAHEVKKTLPQFKKSTHEETSS